MSAEHEVVTGAPAVAAAVEESAEDLYEHAPCGYLSTLEDGTIVRVNATFLRWTGYTREQLLGRKRFQELLTTGAQIYHETHYRPLLRMQGFAREVAVDVVHADGQRIPTLITSTMLQREPGGPIIVRTTIFDATERRWYEQQLVAERKRAQASEARARALAQTLQESLIPPEPPAIPGLDIAAVYRPAGTGDIVGGDFYDVFETLRGDWAIAIGDVAGKGAEAARITAAARYTLRAAAIRSARPRVVLGALNDTLLAQGLDRHCTVAFARMSMREGRVRMTVACGGHPSPLGVSRSGEVRPLGRSGPLLGAFPDASFREVTTDLSPGQAVVFFTDGVTEARASSGEFYGDERLCELLAGSAKSSAREITQRIEHDVVSFQDGMPRDDIALVVVRAPGA